MLEKVTIPEGKAGKWSIQRFTVSDEQAELERLRGMFRSGRFTPAGTYTSLTCAGRGVVMSDVPDEMRDHREAVRQATGHVLINGLGLGMVLAAVLKRPEVTSVTVVELDADVISLVAPHYSDARLSIVHASAFDYQPPKAIRYGAVWHDIWDSICADNLPEMTRLKRKYGRRANWQGCWCEYECRRNAKSGSSWS